MPGRDAQQRQGRAVRYAPALLPVAKSVRPGGLEVTRLAPRILIGRHRTGSIIVTSNRGPDEWLATFADPLRAQSAIDRFVNNGSAPSRATGSAPTRWRRGS